MIKPLADRVLIEPQEAQAQTASGLYIPDTAKEKPSEGIVEAAGNGRMAPDGKLISLTVKAGDRVLFGKYAGTEIKVDGEPRLIIREEDILAIVE